MLSRRKLKKGLHAFIVMFGNFVVGQEFRKSRFGWDPKSRRGLVVVVVVVMVVVVVVVVVGGRGSSLTIYFLKIFFFFKNKNYDVKKMDKE